MTTVCGTGEDIRFCGQKQTLILHVPMILKEFCSSKINGLVMKTFSGK
jgi:hypothetical protein